MGGTTSSYTYSPTPVGWGNGEQALMCPKRVPGGALNYVSGPCTIFFPYKVGHLLSPETQFKRTWSKFAQFHVTWPPIPQPRPHRRRCCVTDGAPGRRPVGSGRPGRALPKPHQLVSFGCVEKRPTANWSDLGVSKTAPGAPRDPAPGICPRAPRQLVRLPTTNWRNLSVENLPQLPK